VITNVITRMSAPSAAMIAGRGSSIRGALGTGQSYADNPLTAYSARRPRCLSGRVPAWSEACV
jgi:hypothetical protein